MHDIVSAATARSGKPVGKFIQKHDVCKRYENSQSRSILNRSDWFDRFQTRKAGWRKTKEIVDSVVDSNNSQILLRSIRESIKTRLCVA
jgi:hypothetical protein